MTAAKNTAKRGYHHGDLRAALVEVGLRMLEERESDDLSLREMARAVGVSATAVYRHFPDKEALRQALAHAAYDKLGEAQRTAAAGMGGVLEEFEAMGRAYVRFALDHPALFRLMMSAPAPADPLSLTPEKDDEAARLLRAYATRLAGQGADELKVRAVAMRAWALVHGLAVLMLSGNIPRDEALIDAVVDARAFGGYGGD
ncbi:TetR/AcrR family transcriptional regulator [Sphingomonas sp. DT-204]|uniref:TetR/AcrR family transcriptional regulator n=1 Tax=Sphingomonas sp. DT-204 TaxID=3396166 RepID=UPI003F1B5EF5